MTFADKAVLITGARRIGAAVAIELAQRGMDVALAYKRSRTEADSVLSEAHRLGRRAIALQADLTSADQCTALVEQAAAQLGRLDVLVNMASLYVAVPFAETDEAAWDSALDVDLKAAFLCAHAAVPHMRSAGGGRIINFSDWVAASGRPRYKGYLAYYVAKKAVIGLTEALALELAASHILVNAIAPGPILPPEGTTADEAAAVEAATPLGHWGGAAEIVKAVVFCIETDFMTGETLRVDGGRHLR
jgi:NAD(P)-dependent dehydrogenase (short-subunit alcohol dehydrogenase family)